MDRALAVVDASDAAKDLVREAGELAAGVGAELVLVHVTDEEEYQENVDALEAIPARDVSYTVGQASEGARQFAQDVANEVLGDLDVEYEAIGRVGGRRETILDTARDHDSDHVFVTGAQRSPTGKAVFGDAAQRVILDFDGPVTVVTE